MVSKLAVPAAVRSLEYMTGSQNSALHELLSAWRRREEAREAASIGDLANARASLDSARANMQSALYSSLR
jgi:hypothetical protein